MPKSLHIAFHNSDVNCTPYPSELRRYSSKRGIAGSSPGADTEFRLRKTNYTCASFKSLRPGPCKTVQHVLVLGLDLRQKLAES